MQCAICGKSIINSVNRDHIYPRAIWKWQEEYLSEKDFQILKAAIESSSNIAKTHPDCNFCKEDTIPEVSALYLSEKKRRQLQSVTQIVKKYLPAYQNLKKEQLQRQHNLCYCCQKPLSEQSVLRRIDEHKPRMRENGCIVCHDCNYSHKNFL